MKPKLKTIMAAEATIFPSVSPEELLAYDKEAQEEVELSEDETSYDPDEDDDGFNDDKDKTDKNEAYQYMPHKKKSPLNGYIRNLRENVMLQTIV